MKAESEFDKLVKEARQASERNDTMRCLTAADEILRRDPSNVDAMFIAGTAFMTNGHEGVAALILNAARCATKDPVKLGPIWNNLGYALQDYQPAEAHRAFKESLKYGETPPYTFDNLCSVATKMGRYVEALDWSAKAGAAFDTSYNKAFPLLAMGRWEEAWEQYSRSAGTPHRPRTERDYDLPRWDGKSEGKVIVHGEQGVGDEIMFLSMLPAGFDGVIETTPRTVDLFARSFPQAKIYGALLHNMIEWPLHEACDWHLEMGGLGQYFGKAPFRRGSYLVADHARCAAWEAWLHSSVGSVRGEGSLCSSRDGVLSRNVRLRDRQSEQSFEPKRFNVGIAWTGGTWSTGRQQRSIPFEIIEELIRTHPDVTFVNLEYEDRKAELSDLPQVLNPHWATKKGADLDDLAALVSSLDLVITATNSTVDLCGALGVPCWALVDAYPQWRYSQKAGEDEMWFYNSVRTFRQSAGDSGTWTRVLNKVSKALREFAGQREAA